MKPKAAITVGRPREEVQRRWEESSYGRSAADAGASVRFAEAPGDRGTEIHAELPAAEGSRVAQIP